MSDTVTNSLASVLTGEMVERIKRLELFSRLRVEGPRTGDNPSPLRGYSTEFLQHRPYYAGDGLKFLDWRVFAKTEKLYVRQFEETTTADMTILLDTSASMGHKGTGMNKLEFAVRCAGILIYLMFLQKDSFAIQLFSEKITEAIPHGGSRKHLLRCFEKLVSVQPAGATRFAESLRQVEARLGRRGLVVVLSDFMDEPHAIARALSHFRLRGHDLIAFQVFDESERQMDYVEFTRFRDMEDGSIIAIDPLLIRDEYRRQFDLHIQHLKESCLAHAVDHAVLPVADGFDIALGEYLRHRAALQM